MKERNRSGEGCSSFPTLFKARAHAFIHAIYCIYAVYCIMKFIVTVLGLVCISLHVSRQCERFIDSLTSLWYLQFNDFRTAKWNGITRRGYHLARGEWRPYKKQILIFPNRTQYAWCNKRTQYPTTTTANLYLCYIIIMMWWVFYRWQVPFPFMSSFLNVVSRIQPLFPHPNLKCVNPNLISAFRSSCSV